jgi:hypothetical protein
MNSLCEYRRGEYINVDSLKASMDHLRISFGTVLGNPFEPNSQIFVRGKN